MSFLWVTIPVSLLVAVCLLALVIQAVRTGAFDDWEGPAQRLLHDADEIPELPAPRTERRGRVQDADDTNLTPG